MARTRPAHIPKDAKPGGYAGAVMVQADGAQATILSVELTVLDLALPDRLSFCARSYALA